MGFSNVFDSSLTDYSNGFEDKDREYLKELWYKKIEKAYNREVHNIITDKYGYVEDYIWNCLIRYTMQYNSSKKFDDIGLSLKVDIPNIENYNGRLLLIVYASKPSEQATLRIGKGIERKAIGDPNTYFKYMLVDISHGFNVVKTDKEGIDLYEARKSIQDLNLNDQRKEKKLLDSMLEKVYNRFEKKAINDTIDYMVNNSEQ